MAGELIKRAFNVFVVVLASLSFFLVPVGRKTAAQHVVAIFTTKPAKEAGAAFAGAAKSAAETVEHGLEKLKKKPATDSSDPDESKKQPNR